MKFKSILFAACTLVLSSGAALAQTQTAPVPQCQNPPSSVQGGTPSSCGYILGYIDGTGHFQQIDSTHPLPTSGGGGGGGAVTVANGADTTEGTINDTHTQGTVVGFLKDIWTALTTGPVPVSGSLTAVTTIGTITNPVTIAQPTAANLNATVVGTGTFAVQEGNSAAILSAIQGPIPVGTNAIGSITNFPSTVATGTGAQGSTVPRTTVATDTATIAGSSPTTALAAAGVGATGSAVPANASYLAAQASAVLKGVTQCDTHAFYDASDNGKKTVVAGVTAKKIYICGFILATGGTATTLSLTSGTGADCVSTSTAITPAYQLIANDRIGANAAFWNGLVTLATADNLCVNASAGNAHQVEIWYTIQ